MSVAEETNPVRRFISALCGNDADALLDWMECVLHRPTVKPDVCVVLNGPPGCGKSLCAKLMVNMASLMGFEAMRTESSPLLLMRNALSRNVIATARLVVLDAQTDILRGVAQLSACISEQTMHVRALFQPPRVVYSRHAFVICTNDTIRSNSPLRSARRFLIIQCGNQNVGDFAEALAQPRVIHAFARGLLKARRMWARLRQMVRLRGIVLYWLYLTSTLMAPGGRAFLRDVAEFEDWYHGVWGP
jgi:hypothetical protein